MNIRICGLCCCLAAGLLFTPAARAEEDLYFKPITPVSVSDKEGDKWWGPGGVLIPETEWRSYVGRKPAFSGSGVFNSWGVDPARMPQLGSLQGNGAKKAAKPKTVATKPVDPCDERVRQALEEAVRTGKIPASAMPQAVNPPSSASPAPSVTPASGASAVPSDAAAQAATLNPATAGTARNP